MGATLHSSRLLEEVVGSREEVGSKKERRWWRWKPRRVVGHLLVTLLSPLAPILLPLMCSSLTLRKAALVRRWRRVVGISATLVWEQVARLEGQERDLATLSSELRMVATSLQAVPQILLLLAYTTSFHLTSLEVAARVLVMLGVVVVALPASLLPPTTSTL